MCAYTLVEAMCRLITVISEGANAGTRQETPQPECDEVPGVGVFFVKTISMHAQSRVQ